MATEQGVTELPVRPGMIALGGARRSPAMRVLRLARRKPLGAVSALIIAVVVFVAIFAPLLAPFDPTDTHPRDKLQSPNATYKLGTDDLGRDVLSRIVFGARTS